MHYLKCSLCGHKFKLDESIPACEGCPLHKGCHLVRCPNCGYDNFPTPEILKKLKEKRMATNENK